MLTLPTYVTRERLAAAMDTSPSRSRLRQLDDACNTGSRSVEALCRRTFWPEVTTHAYDRPAPGETPASYTLWLDPFQLAEAPAAVSSGGVSLDLLDVLPGPEEGPPFDRLDLDLSTSAAWSAGSTWQRGTRITGTFGYRLDTAALGVTAEALDGTETLVDVDGATAAAAGVGDLLAVGSERMLVTDRAWLDTTEDITLTGSVSADSFTAAGTYAQGEWLLLGSEVLRVVEQAGTTVVVERAVDGSTLGDHTAASLYASRTLAVLRGYGGTSAATHLTAAAVVRHAYPAEVEELALAEALVAYSQQLGAYARPQGSGASSTPVASGTLEDARARCRAAHGRYRDAAV